MIIVANTKFSGYKIDSNEKTYIYIARLLLFHSQIQVPRNEIINLIIIASEEAIKGMKK